MIMLNYDSNNKKQKMDANQKTQIVERLKQAQNVLVTVSANPSVDQLSAAIGLTLMMNKLGKHATAVFSGQIPSTLEFLQPDQTLEQNTDSLRDFIISLDKSKADKLRYKVEENVVRIFITPYRTSLSEADLNFSQGDFNVDAVIALGVDLQEHIDQAVVAHGRILHDATVIGVWAGQGTTDVGSINWIDPSASSLCEMLVSISEAFQGGLLDNQMATAFLTGIVSATERFSNDKTSPKVMTMSAQLMAAGANQQLIANKLALPETPPPVAPVTEPPVQPTTDSLPSAENNVSENEDIGDLPPPVAEQSDGSEGIISLHQDEAPPPPPPVVENDKSAKTKDVEEIEIDDQGNLITEEQVKKRSGNYNRGINLTPLPQEEKEDYSGFVTQPPQMGGTLTANSKPEALEPSVDPLSVIPEASIPPIPQKNDELGFNLESSAFEATSGHLTEEKPVESDNSQSQLDAEAARQAVMDAVNSAGYDPSRPEPIQALNAQPLDSNIHNNDSNQPPAVPPPLVPPYPPDVESKPIDPGAEKLPPPDLPTPN